MKFLAFIFVLILTIDLLGQDLHFSQFYNTPLYTNPANAGLVPGDCRGALNYRSQWASITTPFVTAAGSYEKKKYLGKNYLGYGFQFINDRSGTQTLSHNEASFSLAYQKVYSADRFLSIGAQAGFVQKSIKSNLTFNSNFDESQGKFNPSLSNGEALTAPPPLMYPDISIGFMFQKRSDVLAYEIGASLFHILRPSNSFLVSAASDNQFRLEHKYSINGGFDWRIIPNIYLKPKFLMLSQGIHNRQIVFGGELAFNLANGALHAGSYLRRTSTTSDAFIPAVGIVYGPFDFTLSYDINISVLANASDTLGGYEMSLIYNCASSKIFKVAVPCRRY